MSTRYHIRIYFNPALFHNILQVGLNHSDNKNLIKYKLSNSGIATFSTADPETREMIMNQVYTITGRNITTIRYSTSKPTI